MQDTLHLSIEPTVIGLGYELLGIERGRTDGGQLVRVFIDSESGISARDCETDSEDELERARADETDARLKEGQQRQQMRNLVQQARAHHISSSVTAQRAVVLANAKEEDDDTKAFRTVEIEKAEGEKADTEEA